MVDVLLGCIVLFCFVCSWNVTLNLDVTQCEDLCIESAEEVCRLACTHIHKHTHVHTHTHKHVHTQHTYELPFIIG